MNDPLPSWTHGPARAAILGFVAAVTAKGGPDYVSPQERIAVFDNDGTLWCEHPMQVQLRISLERASAMAKADPQLMQRHAFRAILENDMAAIHTLTRQSLLEFAFAIHVGMTVDAFRDIVRHWLGKAHHPKLGRPYTDLIYQPQIELMDFLRANGFKTFIVSGGGVDFIRAFAEVSYSVPPEQVIGSSAKTRVVMDDGFSHLMKLPELETFNDREAKAQNIGRHIGRRPIFAFGNSDGDLAMMRYTLSGPGRRLALLLHHDDEAREAAYDRDFRLSPLSTALDLAEEFGFQVVSMKSDWAAVFRPQSAAISLTAGA